MEASELWLILLGLLLLQVGGFALFGLWRRRQNRPSINGEGEPTTPHAAHPPPTAESPTTATGWPGLRDFVVQRKVYESADRSICSFYLAPLDGLPLPRFRPGQFLLFPLAVACENGEGRESLLRCYSLSDAPGRDYYRVSIKRVLAPPDRPELPPGRGSGHFHDHVEEGSRLAVRAPAGKFYLHEEAELPVVLIAGGIGITPLLSMLGTLLEQGHGRAVTLFYGVRNGAEVALGAQLREWASSDRLFRLYLCFSAPSPTDRHGTDFDHAGRIDLSLLRTTLPLRRHQFYLCGPPQLMESLVSGLLSWGVEAHDILHESFGPSSLKRRSPPPAQAALPAPLITFSRSGRSIPWNPAAASLLEFAEANGIAVSSGCRAGRCGGCQTRLREGRVAYSQPPMLEPDPGYCLLCSATPDGAITLEA